MKCNGLVASIDQSYDAKWKATWMGEGKNHHGYRINRSFKIHDNILIIKYNAWEGQHLA